MIKPEPSDSIKKETLSFLNKIKDQITKGDDFGALAEKHSMDPGSKKKGGDLGWVKRGSLLKNFEEVAFTIKPKSVSDPIKTEVGYHILEVLERKGNKARVRHLLISPQTSKKDEEFAFSFALSLRDSISTVDVFKSFAKKHSKDYQTSEIGGDLGWVVPSTYPIKEIGQAIGLIDLKECSPPINTSFGFHLLWLEKIKSGGKPNLDSHWPKIEMMALNNKKMNWYENWLKDVKHKFYVRIFD